MSKEEQNDLPSINDFTDNDLPSVEDFIENSAENIEEGTQTIEDLNGETFLEVKDIVSPWPELLRLISDVRKDIPKIPEIRYYDEELEHLERAINEIKEQTPEVKYYDAEIEAICEQIDFVKDYISSSLQNIPEIKYYDLELEQLENNISEIKQSFLEIPEIRYYEEDIQGLYSVLEEVKNSIPNVPHWVQETHDVPDFSWYVDVKKTFNTIGENISGVQDSIEKVNSKFEDEVKKLYEEKEILSFETEVDRKNLEAEFLKSKDEIWEELKKTSLRLWETNHLYKDDDRRLKKQITSQYNQLKTNIESKLEEINENSIKTDELLLNYFKNLQEEFDQFPEVKYYEEDINDVKSDIKDVQSDVESLRDIIEDIKFSQKKLQEEQKLLAETNVPLGSDPPETKNPDPLTPIDHNFVTLDQLKEHYRLFVNRVQQQLYTIGGGGAGFIRDLDDVEFDGTTGDNKLLIYDQSRSKWVGIASTALGGGSGTVGSAGTWSTSPAGIHTTKNVGVATTARSDYALYVGGDQYVDGNITVGGTITYEDVKNVDSLGIVTARTGIDVLAGGINVVGVVTATSFEGDGSGLTGVASTDNIITGTAATFNNQVYLNNNVYHTGIATFGATNGIGTVHVGVGTTALLVDGDARVTGILTVGRASVTIDGNNNEIKVGLVTITNSQVILGDNVTINAGATGINSAPNVLYVAKDGNDSNNGTSIDNAKLTIAGAVSIAQSGTTIKVLSGNYVETNPIELPAFTAVIGDDLRTVKVLPSTPTSDIFHVNKGCKVSNITFSGHTAPAAAIAFPTGIATNVGGGKWKGPYIQNCTSDTTTGTGIYIDGNLAEKTKSMNVDAFTQYNQGGVGVAVTNEGYAQLVSVFTICCDKAITVHKGGQADLANSNCSFGTQGLVADGVSPEQFTGIVTASATAAQDNVTINVGAVTTRPYDGQVVYFDQLYKSIETITVGSGGTGYTQAPTVTVDAPTGPNGETASAFATIENGAVTEISIISSGSQYTSTPSITISGPQSGINTATATANMADTYYTINSATPIVSGITTLTLAENLINTVGVGSTAYFFQQSKIVASSHTFEYIGSGNTITLATPKRGGVTIQANEVVSQNGGRVIYTSTDQAGNFRIGDDLQINQATGTISGRAFSKSLFSEITPFILALS